MQNSVFDQYLLEWLNLTESHLVNIREQSAATDSRYLTGLTVIVGGAALLITNQFFALHAIVGLASILIVAFGTQHIRSSIMQFEATHKEVAFTIGIHQYFGQQNPQGFEQSGSRMRVEQRKLPGYWVQFSRAPWKQVKLVGSFAFIHSIAFGVGVALLSISLIDTLRVPISNMLILGVVIVGGMCAFAYFQWIFFQYRDAHIRVRTHHEKLLEAYEQKE